MTLTAGLVTTVVPLADCTDCTVYCSYGVTHCVSTSVSNVSIMYFIWLFIVVVVEGYDNRCQYDGAVTTATYRIDHTIAVAPIDRPSGPDAHPRADGDTTPSSLNATFHRMLLARLLKSSRVAIQA